MANKIQQRRDTAYNWSHINPTLSSGEFGFETDTKKLKIGDGTTAWSALDYFTTGSSGGNITATSLKSATTDIVISTAPAPTAGQVLTAVNGTAATWQTPISGGGSAIISSGDTAPTNPEDNQLWFDTTGGRLYVYFSNTWVDTNPESGGSGSGSSQVTVGSTAPTAPTVGDLWYDTVSGRLYVYFSNTWVDTNPEASSGGGGSTTTMSDVPPSSPIAGDMWFDTTGGRLYIRYSNAWVDTNPTPN